MEEVEGIVVRLVLLVADGEDDDTVECWVINKRRNEQSAVDQSSGEGDVLSSNVWDIQKKRDS